MAQREAACTSSHGTWSDNTCTCDQNALLSISQCVKDNDIISVESNEHDTYSCVCWTGYDWNDSEGACQ